MGVVGLVTSLVMAAFKGVRERLDDTDVRIGKGETDMAALKQAVKDMADRHERQDRKFDDLTATVHSIDKNLAALVAQGKNQ